MFLFHFLMCSRPRCTGKQVLVTNMAIAKRDIAGITTIREMGNPSALQGKHNRAKSIIGGLTLLLGGSKTTAKAANLGGSFSMYGATQLQGMNKVRSQ